MTADGLRINGNLVKIKVKNGICSIENNTVGIGHSAHPNIAASGSVQGMKKLGYWGKMDKTVKVDDYIYNVSVIHCSDALDYLALAIETGMKEDVVLPSAWGESDTVELELRIFDASEGGGACIMPIR